MPQKHDRRFIKRNNRRPQADKPVSGEFLARQLVERGLATQSILGHSIKPQENDQ